MSGRRPPLPLNALRAFEAVGRHLSVRDAARELSVTAPAVSMQVRHLEEYVGVRLLQRQPRGLTLTRAGERLLPALTRGFDEIGGAVGELRSAMENAPLRLSVLPTFATYWLMPRMKDYPFGTAGFDLHISTSHDMVDLHAGHFDAAIRHGNGDWAEVDSELLFRESVDLVVSPADDYPGGESGLRETLAAKTLFMSRHRRDAYKAWRAQFQSTLPAPAACVEVDSTGLAMKAAMEGLGVALVSVEMAAPELDAGRLVRPWPAGYALEQGYYLVCDPARRDDRRFRQFREWLLAQCAAESGNRVTSLTSG
ncbi:LysR substrate-binding domain-containing protein [Arhodomonas sp. AD133]|uniref:LysR substrate-binding domain-containing protein n=1 Tax=Arhodomonas sp. AD133 TaxID=3415009 RepID=UPI003EB75820